MATAADALKQVPFFECLNERHLTRLASKFKERRVAPGTSVVQEGKMSGVGFFIITEGEASVLVEGTKSRNWARVTTSANSRSSRSVSGRPR